MGHPCQRWFNIENRSFCTRMTFCCEEIVYDSSKNMQLWIILLRLYLSCDIFGIGEADNRPTSPFLHNISSILYRDVGKHRARPGARSASAGRQGASSRTRLNGGTASRTWLGGVLRIILAGQGVGHPFP